MVDAPSISAFKGKLDKLRHTVVGFLWINLLSRWSCSAIGSSGTGRLQKIRYNGACRDAEHSYIHQTCSAPFMIKTRPTVHFSVDRE